MSKTSFSYRVPAAIDYQDSSHYEEFKQRLKGLEMEATKIKQTEEAPRLNESRLEALLKLNQMTESSLQEITDFALEEAVKLTQSKIGYLSFMNEGETVLTMHSWSKNAMKQCAMRDKPEIYPVETTGLWGEAVRQREPVITNDYSAPNTFKKGYPEGHVHVIRHMNIPVFDGERIVAVAGVGNKDEEYNESDVRQLTLLIQGMWTLIQRKRTGEAIRLDESRLEALLELNQMTEAPLQEITDFALEEAVKLTQSKIGYLAFMNEEETVLTMHSWSENAMKQCTMRDKPMIYPVETTGLWGEAVRQREPVITNDYSAPTTFKKGYPEGHVHVIRHMNIPVFDGERIVVVAGVGNKDEEYNESDVRQLTLLMQGMWRLIQRKWTNWELKESEAKFRKLVETVGSAIFIYREKKIRFANPAAEAKTGYPLEELRAMDVLDLIHPDYRESIRDKGFSFFQPEEIRRRYEVKILKKYSGEGWFDLSVSTIEYEGQKALLCVAHDVTKRKELEENLRREKSQLEEMNITLRNVMKSIDQESKIHQRAIAKKVEDLLLPALDKVEREPDPSVAKGYFDIIRDQLIGLTSNTNAKPDAKMLRLTPTEMKICQFIQSGSTTKDIAQAMCLSVDTIQTHRKNIRKKLGLSGRRVNLFTFLKAREMT